MSVHPKKRRNRKWRDDDIPATGRDDCPHPHKMAYASRAAAKRARKRFSKGQNASLSPYLCSCRNWHLGRLPAAVKRGARQRLKRE